MTEEHSIEICRDLKRIAGIVHKYGWEPHPITGEEPVGGSTSIAGPGLIYESRFLILPGYFTRAEVDLAVELMYG